MLLTKSLLLNAATRLAELPITGNDTVSCDSCEYSCWAISYEATNEDSHLSAAREEYENLLQKVGCPLDGTLNLERSLYLIEAQNIRFMLLHFLAYSGVYRG